MIDKVTIDIDIFYAIKSSIDNLATCKVACNGILLAKVDEYNKLVAIINMIEGDIK